MMISSPSTPAHATVTWGVPSGSTVTTVANGPVAKSSRRDSGIAAIVSKGSARSLSRRPSPDDGPGHQERGQPQQLCTEDDPVHVDGRPPRHLITRDDERPHRPGVDAEPAARAASLPLRSLPAASSAAALD